MLKHEELADPDSCMNRAGENEWVFVLLGRDSAAPYAIRAWAAERIRLGKNRAGDMQIMEAMMAADSMEGRNRVADLTPEQAQAAPDYRIGLSCKPKYRKHELYYEGRGKIVGVEPSGTAGIVDKDGVLKIELNGRTFLAPADEWMTA